MIAFHIINDSSVENEINCLSLIRNCCCETMITQSSKKLLLIYKVYCTEKRNNSQILRIKKWYFSSSYNNKAYIFTFKKIKEIHFL